jgi:hypothetical protein
MGEKTFTILNKNSRYFWLVTPFILLFADLLLQLSNQRCFRLIDDYTILKTLELLKTDGLISYLYSCFHEGSRFRPMYGLHQLIYTQIFGANIQLISYYYLLLSIITSIVMYQVYLYYCQNHLKALCLNLMLFIGLQVAVWYDFDAVENIGMFFLSLALFTHIIYLKSSKIVYKILFFLLAICMSLSKEPFILFLPFLIVFLKNTLFEKLTIGLLFVTLLCWVVFQVGTTNGYAGVTQESFSWVNIAKIVVQYGIRAYGFSFLLLFVLLYISYKKQLLSILWQNNIIPYYVLGVAVFLGLYLKSGLNTGRYLYPLLFVQLLLLSFMFDLLKNRAFKNIFLAFTAVLISYNFYKFVYTQVSLKKELSSLKNFYNTVKKLPDTASLTMVSHPVNDLEKIVALQEYFNQKTLYYHPYFKVLLIKNEDKKRHSGILNKYRNEYSNSFKELLEIDLIYRVKDKLTTEFSDRYFVIFDQVSQQNIEKRFETKILTESGFPMLLEKTN